MLSDKQKNVAVIMTVYKNDSLSFLKEALNSMIEQSYSLQDIYVGVDGPVPSPVKDFLLSHENSENISVIFFDENRGLASALNSLIDTILDKGIYSYVARMDSDDISRPLRITKQVEFLEEHRDIDVCGTSCREFGATFALNEKHLPLTPHLLLDFSITHCPFIHPSVMFRCSVFESGFRYPVHTALTEDMALWFILLNNGYKFSNINEILIDFRLNENTLLRRTGWSKAVSEFNIRIKNMFSLRKVSLKNITLITSRLVFHILPIFIMKYVYKNMRNNN